ncbi:MAG: hypothetical protein M3P51_14125 [Chloroflexota bacterium]|nr:hypothetical protein [Chloroflexota bacterium]
MSQEIPLDFVHRAQQHLKATGEPLLEYRLEESEHAHQHRDALCPFLRL